MTPLVFEVLGVVAPVFLVIALGWVLGGLRRIEVHSLTELVVYVGGPALVLRAVAVGREPLLELFALGFGAAVVVVGVGVSVKVVAVATGRRLGALYLPAMFMNAGNMLLPLALFAFGEEGLHRAAVVFATMTLLQSTLGVLIASGRADLTEALRLPYVYAVAVGLLLRVTEFELPLVVDRPLSLMADTAVPLMLLALGLRLRSVKIPSWRNPLLVTFARIAGGYVVARIFVAFVPLDPISRSVLLLAAIMPAAVVNFVFAEKYGNESGDVAAAVFVSTLVSLVTTPLFLAFGLA